MSGLAAYGPTTIALSAAWALLALTGVVTFSRWPQGGHVRSVRPEAQRGRRLRAKVLRLRLVRSFRAVLAAVAQTRIARRNAVRLQHELPLAVDLMIVAVGAGATPLAAMAIAARWSPPTIGARLSVVVRQVHFGAPLHEALNTALGNDPALRSLSEILTPAIRLGSPLVPALQRVAVEARASHARQMATIARTVPVRLIFPLVLLVLPAFALLTVVPALVAGWRGL